MRPIFSIIILLSALLLTACNPLRRVQRNQKADSTTIDRSEIRKVVTDILRETGTLLQTVVEYYPPIAQNPAELPDIQATAAVLPTTPPPAVKRIIKTEISTESERTTTTDSLTNNDIRTQAQSELSDKVVEKPPSSVSGIKWAAIGLAALLLIIMILKLSKLRIPGL